MAKKKLHNLMPDTGELPTGVPSVDEAWADMRNKLLEQMPDKTAPVVIEKKNRAWKKYSLFLLLLAFPFAWLLFSTLDNTPKNPEQLSNTEIQKKTSLKTPSDTSNATETLTEAQGATNALETNARAEQNNQPKSETAGSEIVSEETIKTKSAIAEKKYSANPDRNLSEKNKIKKSYPRPSKTKGNGNVAKKGKQTELAVVINSEPDTDSKAEPTIDRSQSNVDSIDLSKIVAKPTVNFIDSHATADAAKALEGWEFRIGLHWTVQVPTYSASDYFTGPNANNQFYRILLPGIWLRMNVEKSSLTAEVNPFYTNLVPAKSFGTFTSVENITDTVVITTEQKTMRKTFGLSATLSYDYRIAERWWIGGGFQAYWLNKGIAQVDVEEERRAINGSGKTNVYYSNTYPMPQDEWAYFTKSHIGLSGQILYEERRWQGGLRFILPVVPLAKQEGPKNPLRLEFIFRVPVIKGTK